MPACAPCSARPNQVWSPALIKALLKASARDVATGKSAMDEPAASGHDGATGAGLVDAQRAYLLVRSTTPRPTTVVPAPL